MNLLGADIVRVKLKGEEPTGETVPEEDLAVLLFEMSSTTRLGYSAGARGYIRGTP